MIVMTLDEMEALKKPLGTPCTCGRGAEPHTVTTVYETPTRWAMRTATHEQSATGIWWVSLASPRYFRTRALADAAATHATMRDTGTTSM